MIDQKEDFVLKILTIGESGVGKTCILLRYAEDRFIKNHLTTIGIDYKAKNTSILGKEVKLKIWDTAGQERFRNITQQYYKSADGILMIFDVTDRNSFEKIEDWMKQINENKQSDKLVIVLVGNKCDSDRREISKEEGQKLANQYFKTKYQETSALLPLNINETFEYLASEIISQKDLTKICKTSNINYANNLSLTPPDNDKKLSKNKKCC